MPTENMSDEGIPACDTISHHVIPTERAGALSVWVQGDLSLAQKAESRDACCCFMTVHDVGVNHNSWLRFINSPSMGPIREKAVILHVDLLGKFFCCQKVQSSEKCQTLAQMSKKLNFKDDSYTLQTSNKFMIVLNILQ